MFEAFRGRTVFFITHRLSTVRPADMIVVMDQGAVMEIGDHASLLERQGWYYALYQSQAQEGLSHGTMEFQSAGAAEQDPPRFLCCGRWWATGLTTLGFWAPLPETVIVQGKLQLLRPAQAVTRAGSRWNRR